MGKILLCLTMVWGIALAMEEGSFDVAQSLDFKSEEEKISSQTVKQNVLNEISIIEQEYKEKKYQEATSRLFDAIHKRDLLKYLKRDLRNEKLKKIENIIESLKQLHNTKIKTTITDIEVYDKKYQDTLNHEQIEQTKRNLKLAKIFHTNLVNLPKLEKMDSKSEKNTYQERAKKFESLVTVMNRDSFFIEKIFHGVKTSIEGNNSVLEKGIFDRLNMTMALLENELDELVGLVQKQSSVQAEYDKK